MSNTHTGLDTCHVLIVTPKSIYLCLLHECTFACRVYIIHIHVDTYSTPFFSTKKIINGLTNFCKRITFGDALFLAPLAVESLRQINYTAKCAFIKV